MLELLRYRDARLLLAGETLSNFGDRAMLLVLAIWAKSLTGSNAAAGLAILAVILPSVAAPLAGLLVDRLRRRLLMIATDGVIAVVILSLLFVHDRHQLWLIYAVGVLYGMTLLVFGAAQSALLTVILPSQLLAAANGAFQTMWQGLRLVAPVAGAALFAAFGGGSVAILDSASFALSAVFLSQLHVKEPTPPPRERRWAVEVAAGLRHVWQTLALRQIVFATGAAFLVIGFTETLGFAVVDQGLHHSPAFIGVLGAVQGVGAIIGGLTAARVLRRIGDGRLVGLGFVLFGLGDSLLIASILPVVAIGFAIAGLGLAWAIVAFGTAIQLRTPAHLQGRTASAADLVVGTPQTISIALGAALSTLVNYRWLLASIAIVMAGSGLYLATRRTFATAA